MLDVFVVLLGLAFCLAASCAASWMLCNPEQTREMVFQGWRGLRDVCAPADTGEGRDA